MPPVAHHYTPDDLRNEVQKISSLVTTARRLLASDKSVDLSALEGKMRHVCAIAALLSPDHARPLLPALEALLASLDELGKDLQAQQSRLEARTASPAPPSSGPSGRDQDQT
ncbi:hypothetical protein [Telmatospirillum sp. J64-1]|uniref:hypothetical protein n=1 Tax=Telmatospirillum sp. J64-1 TaxID=2502183 RepID=UPI00115F5635|nr:hypothetical protein [Telmatospirillum sp. J64-1]